MKWLICDACPLIFLDAVGKLPLISQVFTAPRLVPQVVAGELWGKPDQGGTLAAFLKGCRVVKVSRPGFASAALSLADRSVLTLARREPESGILTDDGCVRRSALALGLPVAGTLGVLIRARRAGLLSIQETTEALDDLVAHHQFRISIELYQEALRLIKSAP